MSPRASLPLPLRASPRFSLRFAVASRHFARSPRSEQFAVIARFSCDAIPLLAALLEYDIRAEMRVFNRAVHDHRDLRARVLFAK